MKRNPLAGISTLVRWQGFKESLALDELRRRGDQARRAGEKADAAKSANEQVQRALSGLLAEPFLDLARLQAVAAIEEEAWSRVQTLAEEHAAAVREQDAARAAHADERTKSRAGNERLRKKSAAFRDRLEKLSFDRTADAHLQNKWRQR